MSAQAFSAGCWPRCRWWICRCPRTLAAALLLAVYWGLTLLYLPFTIITLLAFGFWLPVVIALMILYPGLDKVFKLEETLSARRDAEIEERIAESQPTFHNK